MSSKRKILEMNAASMVGLKAELYKKREEAKQAASQPKPVNRGPKRTPIWARTQQKMDKGTRKCEPTEDKDDEIDLLHRSRQILEAKSRLYEELTQSALPAVDQDDESGYLVDFERKTLEKNYSEEEKQLGINESLDDDNRTTPDGGEEDWVEYIDVFGRSRRCLREDLPQHLQRNDELRQDLSKEAKDKEEEDEEEEEGANEVPCNDEGSSDLRDKLRDHQSTDRDGEELWTIPESINRSKINLHYADVQENEIRDHGVSFYQFSTDETTRTAQMKQLNNMRKVTEENRDRRERIKEKRKAQMELRLSKVKQRRMISDEEKQESSTAPLATGKEEKKMNDDEAIAAKLAELRAQAEQCREKTERINTLFPRREWDRGKAMMSAEKYLEKRRTERCNDFAPPSSYLR